MLTLLEEFHSAPLRPMWAAINAGRVYVGGGTAHSWSVDQSLNCRRCDELTMARMRLDDWLEFVRLLADEKLKCGACGGELTTDSAIIKLPPLDKRSIQS